MKVQQGHAALKQGTLGGLGVESSTSPVRTREDWCCHGAGQLRCRRGHNKMHARPSVWTRRTVVSEGRNHPGADAEGATAGHRRWRRRQKSRDTWLPGGESSGVGATEFWGRRRDSAGQRGEGKRMTWR